MFNSPVAAKRNDDKLQLMPEQTMDIQEEERRYWDGIFDKLDKGDGSNDGKIDRQALVKWISALDLSHRIEFEKHLDVSPRQIERLVIKADKNNDGFFDKEEFFSLVQNKSQLLTQRQESLFRQYFQVVAYAEEYKYWPPPWFTISLTLFHTLFYVIQKVIQGDDLYPNCSYLIYSPFRRIELWRFLTYMFIHVDTQHILMNMVLQLLVGLPLEMSHGPKRVAAVYFCGVISGSLATSIFEPQVFLAGASGGIYALVTAHLATLILNWKEDMVILQQRFRRKSRNPAAKFHGNMIRLLRLSVVLLYAVIDMALFVTRRIREHHGGEKDNVSVVAHVSGAVTGILIGIIVLKNRKVQTWEIKLKIICFILYAFFVGTCFLLNVIGNHLRSDFFPAFKPLNCKEGMKAI